MTLNKYILLVGLFGCVLSGYSQSGAVKKASKDYDKFSYIKTSEILLSLANDGYKSVDLLQKLGNPFYFNNKNEEAAKWYGELMLLDDSVDAEYYYRYAQALKSIENYLESDRWMQKFTDSKSNDLRAESFKSRPDYLSRINDKSESFAVNNMAINSELSDFGSNQYKDKLVFSSSRDVSNKIYKWNEEEESFNDDFDFFIVTLPKEENSLARFLQNELEIPEMKLSGQTFSFRDLFKYCYVSQTNIDSENILVE